MSVDAVVVGAGCAGSATSYFLSRAGLSVILLDKEGLAAGSSGHSTGISRVLLRDTDNSALASLNSRAIPKLERAIPQIEYETGMDVQYQVGPGMTIPLTEEAWERMLAIAPAAGHTMLSAGAVHELEPGLGPEVLGAAWEPNRRKLDSAQLTRTYAAAAERHGAEVVIGEAISIKVTNGRVTAVVTPDRTLSCGNVVIAMGVGTAAAGDWLGVPIPVLAVKGEALRLEYSGPTAKHFLTPFGLRPGFVEAGHVIFRKDGVVSVGSTMEETGFDASPTEGARERIMRMARFLWPALENATVKEHVSGLRPVPADGLPILGPVPDVENAYITSGHTVCACSALYAELTTDLITTGATDIVESLESFSLNRFVGTTIEDLEVYGLIRHMRAAAPVIAAGRTS